MCCRYLFDDTTLRELWETVNYVDNKLKWTAGDVYPSDHAIVITGQKEELKAERMKWGISNSSNPKQLIINARAETALSKPTFATATEHRRCIIPATHFYEWDKEKNKVTFSMESGETLFMAGIYLPYIDGNNFVVLTTGANESMKPVHDRMPLIFPKNELESWIFDDEKVGWFLKRQSPILHRYQEYQQLSLFDLQ